MLCICYRVKLHFMSSSLNCSKRIWSWACAQRCLLAWFLTVYYSVWQFSTTISQHRVVSDVSYLSQSFQVKRRLLTSSRHLTVCDAIYHIWAFESKDTVSHHHESSACAMWWGCVSASHSSRSKQPWLAVSISMCGKLCSSARRARCDWMVLKDNALRQAHKHLRCNAPQPVIPSDTVLCNICWRIGKRVVSN